MRFYPLFFSGTPYTALYRFSNYHRIDPLESSGLA
jgi:hypothetical protein